MSEAPVFLVVLRRPKSATSNPDEMRSDPFWEFGSFGITGCHARNLMNPKRIKQLAGARLAFAQGGPQGTRLVFLTPPIRIASHAKCTEALWTPHKMPFRYLEAPTLARNPGTSDFSLLKKLLSGGKRTTMEGQFASQFRSRTKRLDDALAKQLICVYSEMRGEASRSAIATQYADALPKLPPCPDTDRLFSYSSRLEAANRKSLEPELATVHVVKAEQNGKPRKSPAPINAVVVGCGTSIRKQRTPPC